MICQTCGQPVVEIIDYDFEPTGNYVHESEGFDHLVRLEVCKPSEHDWVTERDGMLDGKPAYATHCATCGTTTPRHT